MENLMKKTKEEIISLLTKSELKIKELEEAKLDPEKIVREKSISEKIGKSEKAVKCKEENTLEEVQEGFNASIDEILENIDNHIKAYQYLQEGVGIKKEDLKEVCEIEEYAENLAGLINTAQESYLDLLEKEEEERDKINKELAKLEEEIKENNSNIEDIWDSKEAEIIKERKRQQEEWKYEFNCRKQYTRDELDDEMESLRKATLDEIEEITEELNKKQLAIIAREEEIEEKGDYISELEVKAEEFPDKLKEEIEEAVAEAKQRAKSSYNYEVRYLKSEHNSERKLLEAENNTLKEVIEKHEAAIDELRTKLNAAYTEIKEVAIKTVEGAKSSN